MRKKVAKKHIYCFFVCLEPTASIQGADSLAVVHGGLPPEGNIPSKTGRRRDGAKRGGIHAFGKCYIPYTSQGNKEVSFFPRLRRSNLQCAYHQSNTHTVTTGRISPLHPTLTLSVATIEAASLFRPTSITTPRLRKCCYPITSLELYFECLRHLLSTPCYRYVPICKSCVVLLFIVLRLPLFSKTRFRMGLKSISSSFSSSSGEGASENIRSPPVVAYIS